MPTLYLILACAFWGLSFPIVKALQLEQAARLPGASDSFLAAWIQLARFTFAALLILPLILRRARPTRSELRQGLLLSVWGGLGMGVQTWGLAHTSASTSAFLTQAYCVLLPLIACLKARRPPTFRIFGSTLLVVAGVAVLAGLSPAQLALGPGEKATLLAALLFTFQILTLENPSFATNRGTVITFIMCAGIGVLFLPVTLVLSPTPSAILTAGASTSALVLVLSLTIFCSVAAFLLQNTWQRRVSATEAGLIYTTEPVFAAAYALVLPTILGRLCGVDYSNESLTLQLLIGGALILAANLWMQWKRRPHRPSIAPAP